MTTSRKTIVVASDGTLCSRSGNNTTMNLEVPMANCKAVEAPTTEQRSPKTATHTGSGLSRQNPENPPGSRKHLCKPKPVAQKPRQNPDGATITRSSVSKLRKQFRKLGIPVKSILSQDAQSAMRQYERRGDHRRRAEVRGGRAGSWVRDLTNEGIEPNPGPRDPRAPPVLNLDPDEDFPLGVPPDVQTQLVLNSHDRRVVNIINEIRRSARQAQSVVPLLVDRAASFGVLIIDGRARRVPCLFGVVAAALPTLPVTYPEQFNTPEIVAQQAEVLGWLRDLTREGVEPNPGPHTYYECDTPDCVLPHYHERQAKAKDGKVSAPRSPVSPTSPSKPLDKAARRVAEKAKDKRLCKFDLCLIIDCKNAHHHRRHDDDEDALDITKLVGPVDEVLQVIDSHDHPVNEVVSAAPLTIKQSKKRALRAKSYSPKSRKPKVHRPRLSIMIPVDSPRGTPLLLPQSPPRPQSPPTRPPRPLVSSGARAGDDSNNVVQQSTHVSGVQNPKPEINRRDISSVIDRYINNALRGFNVKADDDDEKVDDDKPQSPINNSPPVVNVQSPIVGQPNVPSIDLTFLSSPTLSPQSAHVAVQGGVTLLPGVPMPTLPSGPPSSQLYIAPPSPPMSPAQSPQNAPRESLKSPTRIPLSRFYFAPSPPSTPLAQPAVEVAAVVPEEFPDLSDVLDELEAQDPRQRGMVLEHGDLPRLFNDEGPLLTCTIEGFIWLVILLLCTVVGACMCAVITLTNFVGKLAPKRMHQLTPLAYEHAEDKEYPDRVLVQKEVDVWTYGESTYDIPFLNSAIIEAVIWVWHCATGFAFSRFRSVTNASLDELDPQRRAVSSVAAPMILDSLTDAMRARADLYNAENIFHARGFRSIRRVMVDYELFSALTRCSNASSVRAYALDGAAVPLHSALVQLMTALKKPDGEPYPPGYFYAQSNITIVTQTIMYTCNQLILKEYLMRDACMPVDTTMSLPAFRPALTPWTAWKSGGYTAKSVLLVLCRSVSTITTALKYWLVMDCLGMAFSLFPMRLMISAFTVIGFAQFVMGFIEQSMGTAFLTMVSFIVTACHACFLLLGASPSFALTRWLVMNAFLTSRPGSFAHTLNPSYWNTHVTLSSNPFQAILSPTLNGTNLSPTRSLDFVKLHGQTLSIGEDLVEYGGSSRTRYSNLMSTPSLVNTLVKLSTARLRTPYKVDILQSTSKVNSAPRWLMADLHSSLSLNPELQISKEHLTTYFTLPNPPSYISRMTHALLTMTARSYVDSMLTSVVAIDHTGKNFLIPLRCVSQKLQTTLKSLFDNAPRPSVIGRVIGGGRLFSNLKRLSFTQGVSRPPYWQILPALQSGWHYAVSSALTLNELPKNWLEKLNKHADTPSLYRSVANLRIYNFLSTHQSSTWPASIEPSLTPESCYDLLEPAEGIYQGEEKWLCEQLTSSRHFSKAYTSELTSLGLRLSSARCQEQSNQGAAGRVARALCLQMANKYFAALSMGSTSQTDAGQIPLGLPWRTLLYSKDTVSLRLSRTKFMSWLMSDLVSLLPGQHSTRSCKPTTALQLMGTDTNHISECQTLKHVILHHLYDSPLMHHVRRHLPLFFLVIPLMSPYLIDHLFSSIMALSPVLTYTFLGRALAQASKYTMWILLYILSPVDYGLTLLFMAYTAGLNARRIVHQPGMAITTGVVYAIIQSQMYDVKLL